MSIGEWTQQVHQGDAATTLRDLPESSVHFAMTSPPYYQQRDYGVDGQIGREAHHSEYVDAIAEVMAELRRVLRPDGVCWFVIGDKYATEGPGNPENYTTSTLHGGDISDDYLKTLKNSYSGAGSTTGEGVRRKSRMLIPERVTIRLVEDGWVVRNKAPWPKRNPDSATDRLWKSSEYIYLLAPNPTYWHAPEHLRDWEWFDVSPAQSPEQHFAVFPERLCETPIRATCPPRVCPECGTPFTRERRTRPPRSAEEVDRRQTKRAFELAEEAGLSEAHFAACRSVGFSDAGMGAETQTGAGANSAEVRRLADEAKDVLGGYFREFVQAVVTFGPWKPACDCEADGPVPGIAIDPFAGTGTTLKVAKDHGRRFLGIELNPKYRAIAQRRLGVDVEQPELLLDDDQPSLRTFADGGFTSLVDKRNAGGRSE